MFLLQKDRVDLFQHYVLLPAFIVSILIRGVDLYYTTDNNYFYELYVNSNNRRDDKWTDHMDLIGQSKNIQVLIAVQFYNV